MGPFWSVRLRKSVFWGAMRGLYRWLVALRCTLSPRSDQTRTRTPAYSGCWTTSTRTWRRPPRRCGSRRGTRSGCVYYGTAPRSRTHTYKKKDTRLTCTHATNQNKTAQTDPRAVDGLPPLPLHRHPRHHPRPPPRARLHVKPKAQWHGLWTTGAPLPLFFFWGGGGAGRRALCFWPRRCFLDPLRRGDGGVFVFCGYAIRQGTVH